MNERRPRIAHVVHCDGPGGGPSSVIRQLKCFRADCDQLAVFGGRGRIEKWCREKGVPYRHIPLQRKRYLALGFICLVHAMRRFKPDLAIVHGQWAGPVGAAAARLAGVSRVVYVARWPAFYTSGDLWRSGRNFAAERLATRLADRIVVLSEGSRYQYMIRNMADAENMVLIPNRFDPERLPTPEAAARVRTLHRWSPENLHVLSASRLSDQKRVDWLLQSWTDVERRVPSARLWILGDGPARRSLERLVANLGLSSSVTFLGQRDDAVAYVLASDLVVMTSLYEGHANVPLEAAACGRPIVASDVDGVRESLTDGEDGFLVPPADTVSFAGRIVQLLEDGPLRERMGRKALERSLSLNPDTEEVTFRRLLRRMGVLPDTEDGISSRHVL